MKIVYSMSLAVCAFAPELRADDTEIADCVESGRAMGERSGTMFCNALESSVHRVWSVPERVCSSLVTSSCRQALGEAVASRTRCNDLVTRDVDGAYGRYTRALVEMCPEAPQAVACPWSGAIVHRHLWCRYGDAYYAHVDGAWYPYAGQHVENGVKVYHLWTGDDAVRYVPGPDLSLVFAW